MAETSSTKRTTLPAAGGKAAKKPWPAAGKARGGRIKKIPRPPPPPPSLVQTDVIFPIHDPHMQEIIDGTANHDFRKYLLKPSIKRIWFYRPNPHFSVEYICEIEPAVTRSGDARLVEDGLGNKEFNEGLAGWAGYDYAYKIVSVYKIRQTVTLKELKDDHGLNYRRAWNYTPQSLSNQVVWSVQQKVR